MRLGGWMNIKSKLVSLFLFVFASASGFAFAQKTRFVGDLSIKSNEADEARSFLSVEGIAADSKGNIYALASREYRVQVYGPNGEYLWTIGKKGQGPGEFEMPVAIVMDNDDRLCVFDFMKSAFIVFDPQGKYLKNISTKGKYLDVANRIVIDSGGHFIIGYDSVPEESFKISRFDKKFDGVEHLYIKTGVSSLLRKPGGYVTQAPFAPEVVWAMDEKGYLYICYNNSYEIEVYSPGRELLRTISRKTVPDRVTKTEIDDILKRSRGLLTVGDFPKYKPVLSRLFVVAGRLFVLVKRIEQAYVFHVYDRDGSFVEEINLDFQPWVWKNGHVYTMKMSRDFTECEILRYKVSF